MLLELWQSAALRKVHYNQCLENLLLQKSLHRTESSHLAALGFRLYCDRLYLPPVSLLPAHIGLVSVYYLFFVLPLNLVSTFLGQNRHS